MPTARFTGRVFPAALDVSIPDRPTFHWKADDLGLDMTFQVQIQSGSIVVDCEINKFDASVHFVPLFMRAYDIARASADLAAFATGNGLTIVLDSFTEPAGGIVPMAAQQPSLAALASAAKPGTEDFEKILRIVLAEPPLFLAMRDLIEAISLPHRAPVNCARAIRALRPYFGPPGRRWSEAAWLALREKLQISKTYMQKIMRPSQVARNGNDGQGSDGGATDIIHRAWIVMNRFFEYRKRGGQPLPLSEFPLLV